MKQQLQNKLFKKYPKIFRQKDLPKEETCMCWGIECPDEWYDPIFHLCEFIQNYVDTHHVKQVEAVQIKEKFGKLRFYTNYNDPYVQGAIGMTQYFLQPYLSWHEPEILNQPLNQPLPHPMDYQLSEKEVKQLRKNKKKIGKFALKKLKEKI